MIYRNRVQLEKYAATHGLPIRIKTGSSLGPTKDGNICYRWNVGDNVHAPHLGFDSLMQIQEWIEDRIASEQHQPLHRRAR